MMANNEETHGPESPYAGDLVPRPDPTALTTAQLRRELSMLRELMEANLDGIKSRIDSMDKASELLHANLERVVRPHDIESLRELTMSRIDRSEAVSTEKFGRVEMQFVELDKRTSQLKTASDTAIQAAMAAAEKAVGENNRSFSAAVTKSENTTGESLKNLDSLFKTEIRAITDKVVSLASRQDRSDGSNASLLAIGSGAVAMMSLLIAAYVAFRPASPPVVSYVPLPTAMPVPAPVTVPR
jgi:hypothetical protein